MKNEQKADRATQPRPSPPTSEIGSVGFGSARSEAFGSTLSEQDVEEERDNIQVMYAQESAKEQEENVSSSDGLPR